MSPWDTLTTFTMSFLGPHKLLLVGHSNEHALNVQTTQKSAWKNHSTHPHRKGYTKDCSLARWNKISCSVPRGIVRKSSNHSSKTLNNHSQGFLLWECRLLLCWDWLMTEAEEARICWLKHTASKKQITFFQESGWRPFQSCIYGRGLSWLNQQEASKKERKLLGVWCLRHY